MDHNMFFLLAVVMVLEFEQRNTDATFPLGIRPVSVFSVG